MAELPKIDSEGLRLAKKAGSARVSSVVHVSKSKQHQIQQERRMPSEEEIDAAARAVFTAWRTHVLSERGVDSRRIAASFDALDESERKFALSNAKAALVAAENVRAR